MSPVNSNERGGHDGPQNQDFSLADEKAISSVFESLHDGSSISTPREDAGTTILAEAAGPSALQNRLLRLELTPAAGNDGFSRVSSRRPSANVGVTGEPRDLPQRDDLYIDEDAMDMSDMHAPVQETREQAIAAATSALSWNHEQPCRRNPNSLHDMSLFLASWRLDYTHGNLSSRITEDVIRVPELQRPAVVSLDDILRHGFDYQGIDWSALGTTWAEAKAHRQRYHHHPHVRLYPPSQHTARLPNNNRTFLFQRVATEHRAWIEHFQLRNLVAMTSHNDVHYVSHSKIMSVSGSNSYCAMDLRRLSTSDRTAGDFHLTSLAATGNTLIAGGYKGEYAIQNLASEYGTEPTTGYVHHEDTAITNNIHVTNSRYTGSPFAVFCSNDKYVRTLDCATGQVISNIGYSDVMNCAATAPNGRLRVLTGDYEGALIVDADSGQILRHVNGGSRGHGFACAWAPDDIHVATSGQDCQVLVWDARNWSMPIASIATESTHATSLTFSPLGGGSPMLIAAEAEDTVNIINARTFATKQTIDFFGDIAGTAISEDGSQLTIANGDRHLGGLMTFRRNDYGVAPEFDRATGSRTGSRKQMYANRSDWLGESHLEYHPCVRLDAKARRRRGLMMDDMFF